VDIAEQVFKVVRLCIFGLYGAIQMLLLLLLKVEVTLRRPRKSCDFVNSIARDAPKGFEPKFTQILTTFGRRTY